MTERMEVQRTIAAPAADIFAVLCDPHGHVAIDASGMLQELEVFGRERFPQIVQTVALSQPHRRSGRCSRSYRIAVPAPDCPCAGDKRLAWQ